jgi:hypothetical protein
MLHLLLQKQLQTPLRRLPQTERQETRTAQGIGLPLGPQYPQAPITSFLDLTQYLFLQFLLLLQTLALSILRDRQ